MAQAVQSQRIEKCGWIITDWKRVWYIAYGGCQMNIVSIAFYIF